MNRRQFAVFVLIVIVTTSVFSQSDESLEKRVEYLEEQIEILQSILSDYGLTKLENTNSTNINTHEPNIQVEIQPVSVELLSLTYNESNSANNYANDFRDWISFTFLFTNNLEQRIRAAKGSVVFMDLFGEEWWNIGLTLNDPIEPGETISWIGQIDYNGFIDAHKTARRSDPKGIQIRYDVEQILLDDGTKITF